MGCMAENRFEPVPLPDIRLRGKIAALTDTFFRERVTSEYAWNVIYRETEDAFRNQLDDRGAVGRWQGEYWGKWIISACRVCRYQHNDSLKAFISRASANLIALQRADGYIGTYRDSLNMFSPDPEKAIAEVGYPCKWNWNIWCRKYTLWGLLESYELNQEEQVLSAAVRLADHLIRELEENGIDIRKTGTFCGLASCSILKPMLILYRHTGNEKYLDFGKAIARQWEGEEAPGLIANSLAMKPIDSWYEDTLSWSKVYEGLSCFDGLLELYRVTGEKKYLNAAECFWKLLETGEKNLLFSVGYNDQYRGAAGEINVLTEPCDVIHYMRLCFELFRLTGRAEYMDSFELAFCNPLLAAACKDGKWGARTVRGCGKHEYAHMQAFMRYNHCCVNNMPRGFLNAAESTVMTGEGAVLINLYHACDARVRLGDTRVLVHTDGDYLADSSARIRLAFEGDAADVLLRVPSWSGKNSIWVGKERREVQPGLYRVKAEELLQAGESAGGPLCVTLRVAFDNTPVLRLFGKEVPHHGREDWQYRRWGRAEDYDRALGRTFLDSPRATLRKGPILLCRSKLIGNTAEEMFEDGGRVPEDSVCTLDKLEAPADVMALFTARFRGGPKGKELLSAKVCDYASAANMEQDDGEYFSIYF